MERLTFKFIKALVVAVGLLTAACAQDGVNNNSEANNNRNKPTCPMCLGVEATEGYQLLVANSLGDKIVGAKVMVGPKKDVPFKNNIFSTNSSGMISFSENISDNTPVTIWQNGYVTASFFIAASQQNHLFKIYETDQSVDPNAPEKIEVKGVAKGFGDLSKKDKYIDFALVIPTFTRQALMRFDLSSVISPEVDVIKVIGQKVELPSNLSLPKQKENYSFFTISLNKPTYRSFVRKAGLYQFVALRGRFPAKQVIDDARAKKSIYEIINRFDFVGAGFNELAVTSDISGQDIDVSQAAFAGTVNVIAPTIPAGHAMISLALANDNGRLYPTDLKSIKSGQSLALKSSASKPNKKLVLSLLRKSESKNTVSLNISKSIYRAVENTNQMSLVMQEGAALVKAPQFLPLVEAPVVSGTTITMNTPKLLDGLQAIGTYAILSQIEMVGNGKRKNEKRTRLWEAFSSDWVETISLPSSDFVLDKNKKYRWEVMFLAAGHGNKISDATHITRNATDF